MELKGITVHNNLAIQGDTPRIHSMELKGTQKSLSFTRCTECSRIHSMELKVRQVLQRSPEGRVYAENPFNGIERHGFLHRGPAGQTRIESIQWN